MLRATILSSVLLLAFSASKASSNRIAGVYKLDRQADEDEHSHYLIHTDRNQFYWGTTESAGRSMTGYFFQLVLVRNDKVNQRLVFQDYTTNEEGEPVLEPYYLSYTMRGKRGAEIIDSLKVTLDPQAEGSDLRDSPEMKILADNRLRDFEEARVGERITFVRFSYAQQVIGFYFDEIEESYYLLSESEFLLPSPNGRLLRFAVYGSGGRLEMTRVQSPIFGDDPDVSPYTIDARFQEGDETPARIKFTSKRDVQLYPFEDSDFYVELTPLPIDSDPELWDDDEARDEFIRIRERYLNYSPITLVKER